MSKVLAMLLVANIVVTSVMLWKVSSVVQQVEQMRTTVSSTLAVAEAIKTVVLGGAADRAALAEDGLKGMAEIWNKLKKQPLSEGQDGV
jgi:hypothetical protein